MGYLRALTIAPQSMRKTIERELRANFAYKVLRQHDHHFLVAYAGRYLPPFDLKRTCTFAVDGRNIGYYQQGNRRAAEVFGAGIEITIGIAIQLSRMRRMPEQGKRILGKLETLSHGGVEESKAVNRFSVRFDLPPTDAAPVSALIRRLMKILDKAAMPYRACLFDGPDGEVFGTLSDEGLYVGPSAHAVASWEQEVRRTEQVVVTVSEAEVLLDGNGITGLP